jgi:hypothetical protein
MLDDPRALRLGDLAGPVGRRGIDDEDLVHERHAADHLTHGPPHDRPDGLLFVEGRQDQRHRDALLLLQLDEPPQVRELGVVEVRLAEPALDPGRDGTGLLGCPVRGGQALRLRSERIERRPADGLAGLHDHHGGLRSRGDRLGECPEQVRIRRIAARHGRSAHHDEVRLLGFPQDRVPDIGRFAQDRLALALEVLLDERGERPFRLGPDRHRDARRHEVQDDDRGPVVRRDGVGEPDRQLRVRAATDRDQHPLDVARPALLDHGDVARGVADHLVDRGREDRRAAVPAVRAARCLAAPAEDDEVALLLGRSLDDAFGGVPADPHDGVDRRAGRPVVEHLLEQPAGVAGPGRALGQGHALGHLDDAERRDLAGPRVQHRRPQPDQLLGRAGVGDRDQDADGEWRLRAHASAFRSTACQRSTRYGFSSSNARAWRSTRSSAWSVVTLRFSMMNEPTRPK